MKRETRSRKWKENENESIGKIDQVDLFLMTYGLRTGVNARFVSAQIRRYFLSVDLSTVAKLETVAEKTIDDGG